MTSFPIPHNYADHILVASPSNVVRQRVLESLRSPVRRFEQASGGAEALVHLESGFWQVLFLDRRLPDLDTEELSQTVRQRYRTRDLRPFAGEIERAMAGGESSLTGQSLTGQSFTPIAHEIRGLLERPDGNNVSVERESLLLAQNQLRFQVAVQFMKAEFHRMSLAITGGGTTP